VNTLKTGIIGCGKVADIHAAALRALPQSVFTAVCASTMEKARAFASRYGVAAYDDIAAMRRESGVQAVCICTPHPQHAEAAIVAASAGVHVLVEKPLATSLSDCDRMIAAANKNGVVLGTVCQRRFYEPCQRIHKAIEDGKIGKPILGSVVMYGWRDEKYYASDPWRGSWRGEGGGVLVNQAPHQLDLLLWYMGPVAELCGYWANLNHPYIEVEDTAVAILRFQSGALGQIVVSNSQNPALYGKVLIHGSNGASIGVQTDGGAMFIAGVSGITEPPFNDVWTICGEENLRTDWQKKDADFFGKIDAVAHYHSAQIADFLDAVLQKRDPLITGSAGRRTVELFTAIYRSQRDRCPIRFPLPS
jgi:UDP-N-acetyl-2-amino-2-deoxyglucuronate dehydrogenase